MQKLFSSQENKVLTTVKKSEDELQQFICTNWDKLFPEYIFIAQEFRLEGNVHGLGKKGRIDIFAYHSEKKRFAIFELKQDYNDSVISQAAHYRYYVKSKFAEVCTQAKEKHRAALPKTADINKEDIEIVLIAKIFNDPQIDYALNSNGSIALIKYNWFENDIVLLDYVVEAESTGRKPSEIDKLDEPKCGYAGMTWDKLVSVIKNADHKAVFTSIIPSGVPDTKEQIEELRQFIDCEWGHNKVRCHAYLKYLDKFEKELENDTKNG